MPRGKHFTVFMDFSSALDMLNGAKLMAKLEHVLGPDHATTLILRDIPAYMPKLMTSPFWKS
jgi:hypothetical protein